MKARGLRLQDDPWERRRSEILDSAEKLIAVRGVDALRLRDVADEAGVSIGLLQHYFTSRDDLVRETVHAANETRVAQWSMLARGRTSARERLTALLEGAVADNHRCIVWVETCAAATRHPELRADVDRTQNSWRATLANVIEIGIAQGEFQPWIDVADIVVLLVSLIDGLMLNAATSLAGGSSNEDRVRILRGAANRLLRLDEVEARETPS